MVDEWRTQLQHKSEEFDTLRKQLQQQAPLNPDLFRRQVLEEYQTEMDKRHEMLVTEIERSQHQMLELQREIEDHKAVMKEKV